MRFASDGRSLFLSRAGDTWATIMRYSLGPRTAEVLKELRPREPTGILQMEPVDVTPDGRRYVYFYLRDLSELFLVEGVR